MKKNKIWKTCLLMIFSLSFVMVTNVAQADFFTSLEGRISFTLPSTPIVLQEADLNQEAMEKSGYYIGWQDKILLSGETEAGCEYQVHIADNSMLMNHFIAQYPDQQLGNLQANAILSMVDFYIRPFFGGEIIAIHQASVIKVEEGSALSVSFDYVYGDTQDGDVYQGRGIMDENFRTVILMGKSCPTLSTLMDKMRVLSNPEIEAFLSRTSDTVVLGNMQITLPFPAHCFSDSESECYAVFTPEYIVYSAEYIPYDYRMVKELYYSDMSDNEYLENLAYAIGQNSQNTNDSSDWSVEKIHDGLYCLRERYAANTSGFSTDGSYTMLSLHYLSMSGDYFVQCADTSLGNAFLDTILFDSSAFSAATQSLVLPENLL